MAPSLPRLLLCLLAVVSLTLIAGSLFLATPDLLHGGGYKSQQGLWGPYWTVEPGYTSTLTMKNNRVDYALTVQVGLYFASGQEQHLAPIELQPRQAVAVNLNHAVEALLGEARGEGTLTLYFKAENASALMGSISVSNPEEGTAWNFRLYPRSPLIPPLPLRGLFWFHDSDTDGFVAMQNMSEESIIVVPHFHIDGQVHELAPVSIPAEFGHKLELRNELNRLGFTEVTAGGIELTYTGPGDALRAHGVVFNRRGMSSELDFHQKDVRDEPLLLTRRTPRFALGPADTRLGLPAPIAFDTFLAVHNFAPYPISVNLATGFRDGHTPGEAQATLDLAPGQTRLYRIREVFGEALPANVTWASLEMSYEGNENVLGAELVSVSTNGEHSMRSVLNWVQGSAAEGWYWRADGTHNTLIGIYNADIDPARVRVALDYESQGERRQFVLPEIIIPARVPELVDIAQAIGGMDAEGQPMPPGVITGGYSVRKVGANLGTPLLIETLVVNRQKKNFETFYNTCCSYSSILFWPSSISGFIGDIDRLRIEGVNDCTGVTEDLTEGSGGFTGAKARYHSDNDSVATVNPWDGWVSLVGAGNTTLRSTLEYYEPSHSGGGGGLCFTKSCDATGGCQLVTAPGAANTEVLPPPAQVTIDPLTGVARNGTAGIGISVQPEDATVTLTLSTLSGTGEARFEDNNQSTLTITGTTGVLIKGVTESSTANNIRLTARDSTNQIRATRDFSVVWVELSLRTDGAVSSDNAGLVTYNSVLGTAQLGTFKSSGTGNQIWRTGVEIVGMVSPGNFGDLITIKRRVDEFRRYQQCTLVESGSQFLDTSASELRDDDPQSGSSAGKVYDLDAPGIGSTAATSLFTVLRRRVNFTQWAELGGVAVSEDLQWFSRQSVVKFSSGDERADDVASDNIAGPGVTPLSCLLD